MKRKNAMSAMGYAIVSVIVLAIIMIISAPMLVKKNDGNNVDERREFRNENFEERSENYINVAEELRRIESSLSSRIDQLESAASSGSSSTETVSDKYICTIDKSPEGQLEPIDGEPKKFIFVCEYKK